MKLKKGIFSFLAVLAVLGLAILMCTACMSAEEKEKAKEDVREAMPRNILKIISEGAR